MDEQKEPAAAPKKALGKADLFNAAWPAPVPVDVPELGGTVYVRVLKAAERDNLELAMHKAREEGQSVNYRGRWACACACDEQGKRLFADDDANEMGRMPGTWVDRIARAAQAANLADEASREQARKN